MSGSHLDPQTEIDSPDRRRLPPLLRRAWYGLNQAFRRRLAHTEITPDQFTALRTLLECAAHEVTQCELARLMSSDPNTVGSLLERMEAAGWVKRQPHKNDRRAHRINLLPRGREKYWQARSIALDLQLEVLACLPPERRERFLEDLACLADACREALERTPKSGKNGRSPR